MTRHCTSVSPPIFSPAVRRVFTSEHLDLLAEVFAAVCADFGAALVDSNGKTTTCTCSSNTRRQCSSPNS
jgi:hypothetical protein